MDRSADEPARPGLSLQHQETFTAASILADALEDAGFTSVIEIRTARRALQRALRERCDETFEFAARTFASIDPTVRRAVLDKACEYATDAAMIRRDLPAGLGQALSALSQPKPKPEPKLKPKPKAGSNQGASSFLKALNGGR